MKEDAFANLASLLAPLLSSPEIMGKLGSLFSSGAGESEGSEASESASVSAEPTRRDIGGSERAKRREQLLRALRPYLSPAKCERLDGLVRVSSMLELLNESKTL